MGFVKGTDGIPRTVRNPLEGSVGDIALNDVTVTTLSASTISAAGNANITGNVTGGNVVSSALVRGVTVQASGNLTGGNANISTSVNTVTVNATTVNATTVAVTGNITVSGTGGVSTPNLPAFRVYGNGTTNGLNVTTNGDGILNANNWAVDYNQGSYLNSSTGVFTAPIAGLYQVNLNARCANNSAPTSQAIVYKNYGSANTVQVMWEVAANTTVNHFGVSTMAKLAVNDTLTLKATVGNVTFDPNDSWSVTFIG